MQVGRVTVVVIMPVFVMQDESANDIDTIPTAATIMASV